MTNRKNQFKIAAAGILILSFTFLAAQEKSSIKLPEPQKDIGKPLMQALSLRASSRSFSEKEIPSQELSNILWAANGINRDGSKRTSPSARNWQEIDTYVFLSSGVYLYDAKSQSLLTVKVGDFRGFCGIQDFVKTAPLNLVYISDYSKIKSNDSDELKLMWTSADVGFIAQNVYLYCASQSLACVIRGLIDKPKLSETLNLRADQKIILSQTVGYPK